jgi:hypothetical protein
MVVHIRCAAVGNDLKIITKLMVDYQIPRKIIVLSFFEVLRSVD